LSSRQSTSQGTGSVGFSCQVLLDLGFSRFKWYRNFRFTVLVQESGSFQTTQKVPNKSDFLDLTRISQTVPKVPIKKSDFSQKSDFSNRAQGAHQEIGFFWGKIRFLLKWSGLEISAFLH
jgi:hypothetical protein